MAFVLALGACHAPSEKRHGNATATQNEARRNRLEAFGAKLRRDVAGFDGVVGVYAVDLVSGAELAIRADEVFPTASMIKVPILCALFDRIGRGELDYRAKLTWSKKRIYPGNDLLAKLEDGQKVSMRTLVHLMEALSDNTASLWLQELAGTGTRINEWLAANGYRATRMNSRTPGRKEDWKRYGWGQTSPREMTRLVLQIRAGRGFAEQHAKEMYRQLCRSLWDQTAIAELPPSVQVASKQGAVSASRSEVFVVEAPSGPYACCVITKRQADKSWKPDNAGYELLRRVSRGLWRVFETDSESKATADRRGPRGQ